MGLFQFHIGAIRRRIKWPVMYLQFQFQFHIGAIRSCNSVTVSRVGNNRFNSILVQLEAAPVQVHETIVGGFNSILVQLEAL